MRGSPGHRLRARQEEHEARMKVWPLKPRKQREPAPTIPPAAFGPWMAGGEDECTSEHSLPRETGKQDAGSAVNGQQTEHRESENAVFGSQTEHRDRARSAKANRCSSSTRARDIHSKAHGPSLISAAREIGSRAEIIAGLGFASAAPAEEVIASAEVSPASAAEPTFDFIAIWRSHVAGLHGNRSTATRAKSCAEELLAYEGEVPTPWPLVGSPAAIAREILEGALARGARRRRVHSRETRDFAAGLRQLAAAGLLETTDDLGDGCLTWHGRSLPPLATSP